MLEIKYKAVYSTEGKCVHKIGTNIYSTGKIGILPNDTIDMYEEVDEIPKYTEEDYKTKVQELIAQRYSIEDEIAIINNKEDNSEKHLAEYQEYLVYREKCKENAKNSELYKVD